MSINGRYIVAFDQYTDKHYAKGFEKTYSKRQWLATRSSIEFVLENIVEHIKTDKVRAIHSTDRARIIKLYFKVAGTKESALGSVNRAIVYVDDEKKVIRVLLVYSKNDICKPNETVKWQTVVKREFPVIASMFSL